MFLQKEIDQRDALGYYLFLRSVAQPGSAPGLGPGGPRFESLYSDQIQMKRLKKKFLSLFVFVVAFRELIEDVWFAGLGPD
jgi:hypothetical protein